MIIISPLIKQRLLNSGKSMGPKTTKKLLAVYLTSEAQSSQQIWLSMSYVILFQLQYLLLIWCYVFNDNTCNILNSDEKENQREIPDWYKKNIFFKT
jgi:hypothetical protein